MLLCRVSIGECSDLPIKAQHAPAGALKANAGE